MAAKGETPDSAPGEDGENCPVRPPSLEKPRKHDSGAAAAAVAAADLERVGDYVEESEIACGAHLESAASAVADVGRREREAELASAAVRREDVELMMSEMGVSRAVAERRLREHLGNVVEALVDLTNA